MKDGEDEGIEATEEQTEQVKSMQAQLKNHEEINIKKQEELLQTNKKFMKLTSEISEKELALKEVKTENQDKLKSSPEFIETNKKFVELDNSLKAAFVNGQQASQEQLDELKNLENSIQKQAADALAQDEAAVKVNDDILKAARENNFIQEELLKTAKDDAEAKSEKDREGGKPDKDKEKKEKEKKEKSEQKKGDAGGLAGIIMALPFLMLALSQVGMGTLLKTILVLGAILGAVYLIGKIPSSPIMKLALAIALLGLSLIPLAFGIGLFKKIGWETIGKVAASLVALGLAGFLMGQFSKQILMGALAIAALGASLLVLGLGFSMFNDIGWETMGKVAAAIVGLGIAAAIMGMTPLNILIGIGTVLLLGLGAAVLLVGLGLLAATPAIEAFGSVIEKITGSSITLLETFMKMGSSDMSWSGLFVAALGIAAVGAALLAFTAMQTGGAILGAVGSVFDWASGALGSKKATSLEIMTSMIGFANAAPALDKGVSAIDKLGNALRNLMGIQGEVPAFQQILSFLNDFQNFDSIVFDNVLKVASSIGIITGEESGRVQNESNVNSNTTNKNNIRTELTQEMKQNAPQSSPMQSSVVNNNYNTTAPPAGGGGGGGSTMIPVMLSSNTETTRHAVQIGVRPPG